MKIIIASQNRHKIQEIHTLLSDLKNIELLSLLDFPSYQSPEENGLTFEENALLKATHAASHLKEWALADDSGLVVPALSGRPGVFSARYAGTPSNDKENRKKLLGEMRGLSQEMRAASFVAVLALAKPDGFQKWVQGTISGHICEEEKGKNGFGYDSLFIPNGYNQSFGEMSAEEKNRISHRACALQKMRELILTLL